MSGNVFNKPTGDWTRVQETPTKIVYKQFRGDTVGVSEAILPAFETVPFIDIKHVSIWKTLVKNESGRIVYADYTFTRKRARNRLINMLSKHAE